MNTPTPTTFYLYNGQYGVQTDPNELYYMRQRYYNTEIKRFINQDILTGSINNSQSLNRYCYVQGNPISYTDPFGLSPLGMLKEIGHSVLDVAGLIPGAIGVVADTVNCVWYALEGNTAMAISCGISALPGLGAFAGAKLAVKGGKLAKAGKYISATTSFIGNGVTFTRGGSEALNMGTYMWDKYVIQKEKINGETLGEISILAMGVFTAAASGKACLGSGNALKKLLQPDTPTIKTYTRASGSRSDGQVMSLNLQFFASKSGKTPEIPWSSKAVSDASSQLDNCAKFVFVDNRSQAEELFLGKYHGKGYTNVTGMDAMNAKKLLGGKGNTYHWDDTFGSDGFLIGYGVGNFDGTMPHLQIHPKKGNVIRIFFGTQGGN